MLDVLPRASTFVVLLFRLVVGWLKCEWTFTGSLQVVIFIMQSCAWRFRTVGESEWDILRVSEAMFLIHCGLNLWVFIHRNSMLRLSVRVANVPDISWHSTGMLGLTRAGWSTFYCIHDFEWCVPMVLRDTPKKFDTHPITKWGYWYTVTNYTEPSLRLVHSINLLLFLRLEQINYQWCTQILSYTEVLNSFHACK